MVRDNALAISGLLKERVGGPSVFPYQPAGLWEDTAFGDVYSAQSYTPSHGDDLYRRSMYSFWKRTSGPPSLHHLRCARPGKVHRAPIAHQYAAAGAGSDERPHLCRSRALAGAAHDVRRRPGCRAIASAYGFRLATARAPRPEEVQVLRDLEEKERAQYTRDPGAALKLIAVGESKYNPNVMPAN